MEQAKHPKQAKQPTGRSPGRFRRGGVRVTVRQLAEETGRSRDLITKRLRDAGVEPGSDEKFRLKDALTVVYLFAADAGAIDPDKLEPHVRLAHFKAEAEKLDLAVRAKEFIPVAEVRDELAHVFKLLAQILETVPDILERDCGLAPREIEAVEKHVDKLRTELADRLQAGRTANG